MKKMIFCLMAMVMMSVNVMAQSENNGSHALTFDRMSQFLELRIDQVEPVKLAMTQFVDSQKAVENLPDDKLAKGWGKVIDQHRQKMKKILDEKQYEKYETLLNTSIKNTADRYQEQLTKK